jgi:hypothetical protein
MVFRWKPVLRGHFQITNGFARLNFVCTFIWKRQNSVSFEVTRSATQRHTGQRSPGAGVRWVACPRGMALGGHIIILFYNTRVHGEGGVERHGSRLARIPRERERPSPPGLPQVLLMVTSASSRSGARSRYGRTGLVSMEEKWSLNNQFHIELPSVIKEETGNVLT